MWEAFGTRTLMYATYGGADFGECHVTIDRIGEPLDREPWANVASGGAKLLSETLTVNASRSSSSPPLRVRPATDKAPAAASTTTSASTTGATRHWARRRRRIEIHSETP